MTSVLLDMIIVIKTVITHMDHSHVAVTVHGVLMMMDTLVMVIY